MTQFNSVKLRFDDIGVETRILATLKKNNFTSPTPIQARCIPIALEGKDVVGIAQTGTGKTLAFVLPLLQKIKKGEQALVLAPTRELAIQASEMLQQIGGSLGFKSTTVIGGTPIYAQTKSLRKKPDVIIATPGRLIDHLNRKNINLNSIKIVVLDEADHMFDIGFLPDIKKILAMTPKTKQTLLFSATMPQSIMEIISRFMRAPVHIQTAPSGTPASGINEELFVLNKKSKTSLLKKILDENSGKILIFLRTKVSVREITRSINQMNHSAVEIHSDRSLPQRRRAMDGFKKGKYRILVATDIAARGIDVSNISIVINYDLPQNSEDYVHRIGRTGRSEATGKAISFATPDQKKEIKQIERLTKKIISFKNPSPELSDDKISFQNFKEEQYSSNYRRSPGGRGRKSVSRKKKSNFYGRR
jgi:ATP-dependent RNA helicase RhlE